MTTKEHTWKPAVEDFFQKKVANIRKVEGGYSLAFRRALSFEDGSSCFLKVGVDQQTSDSLRQENQVYSTLESPYLPEFYGFIEGENPILLLEDLSSCEEAIPWSKLKVEKVLFALESFADVKLPNIEALSFVDMLKSSWKGIEQEPTDFLSLGIASETWLRKHIDQLIQFQESIVIEGDELLHFDIRSDNIKFKQGNPIIFDWNWACYAKKELDIAFFLPSMYSEGGPKPWDVYPQGSSYSIFPAGLFGASAGKPPTEPHFKPIRELQKRQAKAAFRWMLTAFELDFEGTCFDNH